MKSEPAAPGAPAVILYWEEQDDDHFHFEHVYVRLKVLTEDGKKYADVELPPYQDGLYKIDSIQGRTIHSDGTVIPFTGKAIDKVVEKGRDFQFRSKVFTLPDVQVGSILEFRYDLDYEANYFISPEWEVQREIPVRSAKYHFVPTERMLENERGEENRGAALYTWLLPPGAKIDYSPGPNVFDLTVQNVPALPEEEYMPPMGSFAYRVQFYYTGVKDSKAYWENEGRYWSKSVDKFASPSGKIQEAVQQIVQPGDSAAVKVSKIYDAIMPLENTSFTRERSKQENKAEGLKVKTAADIWEQKRGNDDEIALLFIAMVRAAGLKAYAMRVTNRDIAIFRANYLSMYQLHDDIAIVEIDGKEQYFDPGQRYCQFGQLHWKHTLTQGIRQTPSGVVEVAESVGVGYQATTVSRTADLTLGADGQVSGTVRIAMSGAEALKWRQAALTSDQEEVKKSFQEALQKRLPAGVQVKTNHFIGLTDQKTLLMAVLDVSGSLGTATSKRLFLPSSFFEASSRPVFSHEKREQPIDMQYPYQVSDKVTLKLPPSFVAESVPKDAQLSLSKRALYGAKYKADGNVYTEGRRLVLAINYFDATEYPELRDFYEKVSTQDQEQLILKAAAAPASGQ